MAAGIDVFFAGLMLICLDGQANCPVGVYAPNTAWVVKADKSVVCGWNSTTETTLELRFKTGDFYRPKSDCEDDKDQPGQTVCKLPQIGDICVLPYPAPQEQRLEGSLKWLPRLDEVDLRFRALRLERVNDPYYVPIRVHFPTGVIGAGAKWPTVEVSTLNPRLWLRSDMSASGALPRELSDRLRVKYERAEKITVKDCAKDLSLIELVPAKDAKAPAVTIRNRADTIDDYEGDYFNDLTYLLWYYRLGLWDTRYGLCPEFSVDKKDAVLLRCRDGNPHCSAYDTQAGTRFWPPMLGPGSY